MIKKFFLLFLFFLFGMSAKAQTLTMTELQWVICEPSESTFFSKLNSKPGKASNRSVYYSETVNLDLYARDATVRTRVTKSKMKTAAKVKETDDSQIPWDFLAGQDYKCEVDSYSGNEKIGCSLYFQPTDQQDLRSRSQDDFLFQQTGFSDFQSLKTLGPAQSKEWQWKEGQLKETLVVESVRAPKSFFSLELSARVPLDRKQAVMSKIRSWLDSKRIQLCPEQKGKTEALLRSLIQTRFKVL